MTQMEVEEVVCYIKEEQTQFEELQEDVQRTIQDFVETVQTYFEAVQSDRCSRLNEVFEKLEHLNQLRNEVDVKTKKWNELKAFVTNFNSQFGQFQSLE